MDFSKRYAGLNAAQKQAVDAIEGPVMVIAGPGTGKTELLSMRAANILRRTDILPQNILCLTFTDSGANAMRARLTDIIGPDAYKVAIHTFHSFGTEIINQNGQFFYQGAHFRPADDLSSYELLCSIFDELDYDNPIASKMNGNYTHISDTLTTISELKRSGLTSDELLAILDANDRVLDHSEPRLREVFATGINKTTAAQLAPLVDVIRDSGDSQVVPTITLLSRVLADSLAAAVAEADAAQSTKPITAWRNAWIKKNQAGEFTLKARDRQVKLRQVSYVYYRYLMRMQESQLYDYDDMILRVVHAMEVFPELRYNLQEKYQYIMVDEFQDTNLAQLRILYNLTHSDLTADQPNILVVGDDDQAIYSFQGADVSNINNFRDTFSATQLVVLTDNYRSSAGILAQAREVITRGDDRLENLIPQLNKTLTPHHTPAVSTVSLVELPAVSDERQWLIDSIQSEIKRGTKPSQIAVLARRHHEIVALLPYFAQAGLQVNYERRDNVLDLDIIQLIEHLAQLTIYLCQQRHHDADSLLPQLLAHPAFGIPAETIWRLSLQAQHNHQSWLEVMAVTPALQPLHAWLVESAKMAVSTPLEPMLDQLIGHRSDDGDNPSPIFDYYFSPANLAAAPDRYLVYLEALRAIRARLREYRPEQTPTLQSFLEFIRLHRQLGSTITAIRPETDRLDSAVNLMTAHKSKGLEFASVYIVGAIDSAWGERVRTRSRLIGYPENLPLNPPGDSFDDHLRLFYVAMTRARDNLTISYSLSDDSGKSTLPASFLTGDDWRPQRPHSATTMDSLVASAETLWYHDITQPITPTLRQLLAPQLERYKLSSTHLNNFLDVTRGGPQTFLLGNLLRFPQAVSPSAGYGSAVHAALQRAHAHLASTGERRPVEDVLHDFEASLKNAQLPDSDYQLYLKKGSTALAAFLADRYDSFAAGQKVELNFAGQGVVCGDARLTGSLDLVDFDGKTVTITDYKTGRAAHSWTGKTDYEKIKLHRYKQQLMFYNLLMAHSRDYAGYQVARGVLQFVEPTAAGDIVALEASCTTEELERFTHLIQRVWHHIITLDLPDTSTYSPDYKGVLAFETDLLDEKV